MNEITVLEMYDIWKNLKNLVYEAIPTTPEEYKLLEDLKDAFNELDTNLKKFNGLSLGDVE